MRVLCVAEKPSIAKSISQILSGGQLTVHNTQTNFIKNYEFDYPQTRSSFIVTSVVGHLTTNDFYDTHRKWHSCDSFELFDAPVETMVPPDKKGVEQNLLTQARSADVLMIWTDCDREGEHIGMEVARVCRRAKANIRVKRARFSAIIAQQIHHAAQNPVELDRRQADAVEARIILDLKVGAAFTRLQTLILQGRVPQIAEGKSVVSYGPCQFPTLGFIVQRYIHAKLFKPETFWYIYLSLTRPTPSQPREETRFNWKRNRCFDQVATMNLYSMIMENPLATVTKVTNKSTKKWKPLPLTTVELQKAGSRLLRLAPKKVLDIAEKLYQQGFVSYPRTETDQFDAQFDFMALIAKQTVDPAWGAFATSLQQGGFGVPRKGNNNDNAHPPIHPTAHAGNLVGDEKNVYEYITRRYLACCSKDGEGWLTMVDVLCGGEEFYATGLIVREKNYLNVYIYDKWTGHLVPDFQEGEEFEPTLCEIRQGETSRPCYLTEADLVTLMDKNGIGTDATIAQHIQTIIDRDYVIERMEGGTKYLVPSTLGIGLIEGYNRIGLAKNVSKPQLRRETERRMVQVCEGTTTKNDMLDRSLDQYKEMFIIVKREFEKVTSSVIRYLSGEGNDQHGPMGGGAGGGGGGPGGGGGGNDDPRGPARGRGRGRRVSRARGGGGDAPMRGDRGRGRGRSTLNANAIIDVDSDDDRKFEDSPATKPLSRQHVPLASVTTAFGGSSSSSTRPKPPNSSTIVIASSSRQTAFASSSRQTAFASSTHQAGSSGYSMPITKPTSNRATMINNPIADVVMCGCDVPAVQRTVTKETASKGKQFWGCSNFEGSCGFFKWVEEAPLASGSRLPTSNVPSKRTYSSAQELQSNGAVRNCKCNEEGIMQTVSRESENKGRKFWTCRKGESARCGFFEWDDEPPRNATAGQGGMTSRTSSLNTNGAGASSGGCFKCGEDGHWASACPNDGNSNNKRSRTFGTSPNDNSVSATCFKCQQPGHYSTACPNDGPKSFRSSGESSKAAAAGECFKCGKSGHWSKDCSKDGDSSFDGSNSKAPYSRGATGKRGRGGGGGRGNGSAKGKRGRGGKKKSAFAAADDY
ncbi:DNA topoisomerase [Crassisporium funariophilum]|nr:DNA topoisomerase [Crassisporium funariophilum]